jgi:uncharacterized membrane protein
MAFFKLIHLLAVLVWVGGMFFAYVVLRPSAAEILQPPERLQLWNKVFSLFFKWVWVAIGLILVTGLLMIHQFGGMQLVPKYVHVMLLLGTIMMAIFAYVFFVPYSKFKFAVSATDWPKAGTILATIRKLVATNLLLGVLTFIVVELSRNI